MPESILLLNPPGSRVFIRDYYCSKVSKSNYLFHPIDLVMLSGRLAERYRVRVIDAVADRLTVEGCLESIAAFAPEVVISLVGAVSLREDLEFLKRVREGGGRLLVTGDATLEDPHRFLEQNPFIDAVVLDFSSADVVAYLEGRGAGRSIVTREVGALSPRVGNEAFDLPVPRHDLFDSRNYRFPFVKHRDFATVLTDYGCPFSCSFCIMSALGYRYRPVDNVLEELRYLNSLGKREIFFIDQTFGLNRKRLLELCSRMGEEGLRFGWVCFSRVDVLDEQMLAAMKGAGCHTIIFGVETASEEILLKYRKGYTKAQIAETFSRCRKLGIWTVATFIVGLPEETEETFAETLRFLKHLDCDFASFNMAVPRMGTGLRQDALDAGLITEDVVVMDQSGSTVTMPTKHLSQEQLGSFRKRAIREFYLRPSYIWRRLRSISSWYELREQVSEGLSLLRGGC